MVTLLMLLIVIAAIMLMGVVLIQSSKGGGLAGTFGGSDASMMFGVRRTTDFLIKLTTVLAVIFLGLSLVTNIIINKSNNNPTTPFDPNTSVQQPQQRVPVEPQTQQNAPEQTPQDKK